MSGPKGTGSTDFADSFTEAKAEGQSTGSPDVISRAREETAIERVGNHQRRTRQGWVLLTEALPTQAHGDKDGNVLYLYRGANGAMMQTLDPWHAWRTSSTPYEYWMKYAPRPEEAEPPALELPAPLTVPHEDLKSQKVMSDEAVHFTSWLDGIADEMRNAPEEDKPDIVPETMEHIAGKVREILHAGEYRNAREVPDKIVHFGDVEIFLNDAWHQVDVESLSITNELDYDYLEVRGRLKKIMRPSDR